MRPDVTSRTIDAASSASTLIAWCAPRARLAGRDHAGEPTLTRAEDDDRIADRKPGHLHRPAEPRAERIEQHRYLRGYPIVYGVDQRVRVEVEVLRVAAP